MKKYKLFLLTFVATTFFVSSIVAADTVTIRPDGQGNWKAWGNIGCGSGTSEWQCVDEATPDISDYLKTKSNGRKETFTFSDTNLTNETINNVTIYYYAMRHNSDSNRCFNAMIRSGGTNYISVTQLCAGSIWGYLSHTYTTNTATGSAWTVAEVDGLEAGMKATNPDSGGRVAQVYAVVNYEPNTPEEPDLIIDSLTFDEQNINGTIYANVAVTVKNIGDATAGASTTRLNGLQIENRSTQSLAPGATKTFNTLYECTAAHNFTATADIFGVVNERYEDNNQDLIYIDCAMPDLIISQLTFIEQEINGTNGTVIYANVTITVKNIGDATAGASTTRLIGLDTDDHSTPSLISGSTYTIVKVYKCTIAHYLNATADIFGVIDESDEINNQDSTYIDCIL